jgi:hypothetical protein
MIHENQKVTGFYESELNVSRGWFANYGQIVNRELFQSDDYYLNEYIYSGIQHAAKYALSMPDKKGIALVLTDQNEQPSQYVRPIAKRREMENYKNLIVFRSGHYRSKLWKNERVLPFLWLGHERHQLDREQVQKIKNIPTITNSRIPTVGFCGATSGRYWNKERLYIVEELSKNKNIEVNAIKRLSYFNQRQQQTRPLWKNEFIDNLEKNLFNICNRGCGNFSMRFYETLCAGRIPILVDSNIELPFKNDIDWNETIILAKSKEELSRKVVRVFDNKDVIKMQKNCKKIWNEYFTEESFIKNMHKML